MPGYLQPKPCLGAPKQDLYAPSLVSRELWKTYPRYKEQSRRNPFMLTDGIIPRQLYLHFEDFLFSKNSIYILSLIHISEPTRPKR